MCVCVFLGSICLTFFLLRDFFFHLFCILLLSCHPLHLVSLHSCTYTDFFVSPWPSLIIFMFFRWSFPASCTLCQSWQKEGEIVENMWFLSKILHVRGRNTFLVRGRMCFILLGGGLTSFFFNLRSCDHVYIHYVYIWWCMSSSPTLSCVVSFLPLYTCFLFLYAIYLFLFHTKMPWCFV